MRIPFRRSGASVLCLLAVSACSRSSTEPPGPAAQLEAVSAAAFTARVGTPLADSLLVRVEDADGRPVPGHTVTWDASFGGVVLSPQVSLSDDRGIARVAVRMGSVAGEHLVIARALTTNGPTSVTFRGLGTPGPVAAISVLPGAGIVSVDDTLRFAAVLRDEHGNGITDGPVTWSSSASGVATVDANGEVRGVAPGTAEIRATRDGKTGVASVQVTRLTSGEDEFNVNSLAEYTQSADVAASWAISDGILTATGIASHSNLLRNGVGFRDGWIEADMDRADEGGLVLRFVDQGNMYLLSLHDEGSLLGDRTLEIFRRVGGRWDLISGSANVDWPRGAMRRIRFEAVGTTLTAYMDGALILSVQDSAILTPGLIGVRYNDVPEDPETDQARYHAIRWAGEQ